MFIVGGAWIFSCLRNSSLPTFLSMKRLSGDFTNRLPLIIVIAQADGPLYKEWGWTLQVLSYDMTLFLKEGSMTIAMECCDILNSNESQGLHSYHQNPTSTISSWTTYICTGLQHVFLIYLTVPMPHLPARYYYNCLTPSPRAA